MSVPAGFALPKARGVAAAADGAAEDVEPTGYDRDDIDAASDTFNADDAGGAADDDDASVATSNPSPSPHSGGAAAFPAPAFPPIGGAGFSLLPSASGTPQRGTAGGAGSKRPPTTPMAAAAAKRAKTADAKTPGKALPKNAGLMAAAAAAAAAADDSSTAAGVGKKKEKILSRDYESWRTSMPLQVLTW